MIEIVLLAFNILLLMLIWECFFKKTLLDTHRDKLFDLRCELRAAFAQKNALNSSAYKETRDLLNAQIALTENLSFLQYILWNNFRRKNKLNQVADDVKYEAKYHISDAELDEVIKKTRVSASDVCASYMVTSSLLLTLIVFTLSVIIGVCMLFKHFTSIFSITIGKERILKIWERAIQKLNLTQDIVEDASMLLIKKS
ncbi:MULTISPECIES: hypothetical protein [unclassified Acinetobacter]|uniref:hypothetical protein n=1 Tax=unclassified Acinetobacter TaxID=196816 RepID=UPI002934CF41|nr:MULTISPECIES: hypothetical protein [unclassified Acinetobacter]WOE31965.1 hypothetical protein QSG84_01690 [Acinetobacter sp. SAAs470]WOE37433.1 hypothetical protein QSG86_10735 [Acinetobacter sp. SAAs474]